MASAPIVADPGFGKTAGPRPGTATAAAPAEATTRQRFEYKVWATEKQAEQLLRLGQGHLALDPYCVQGPQQNISLYFDSPRRTFFEMHLAAAPDRLKLRIRTYDAPGSPAFLEVKRRVKAVTLKHRTTIPASVAEAVAGGDIDALDGIPQSPALCEFLFFYQRYMVEPVLLVAARRLALSSADDGGRFRLTVDRDIRFQRPWGNSLKGRAGGWIPVDLTVRSGHPALLVLVEMKFVHAAPAWLAPALSVLGLRPTSFSKYVAALSQDLGESDGWGPIRGSTDDGEGD